MSKIVIIGAGAMGSAFAVPCADNSNEVFLVGSFLAKVFSDPPMNIAEISKNGEIFKLKDNNRKNTTSINIPVRCT